MTASRGHRLFAALWDFATRHEGRRERRVREWVAAGARGRVLEIGVGVGANWRYLRDDVDYSGIEPDPYMLRRAKHHRKEAQRNLDLVEAPAERLPFADRTFDTVFTTLTLCSVSDLQESLAEVSRVLKPGGEFRYWEHVRPEGRIGRTAFDLLTPAWRRIGAGCHPNRETEAALRAAGFVIEQSHRVRAAIPMRAGVAIVGDRGDH